MADNKFTDTYKELTSYLPKLTDGISLCCDSLRNGDINKGTTLLSGILDGIGWVLDAAVLTEPLNNIHIDIQGMNDTLSGLLNAIQTGDYILTADMLEYEIAPILTSFMDNAKNKPGDRYDG